MNPKNVWAIVLIVVGVLFIIGGISGYHDTSFYGSEIESMGRMMKKYGGKVGNEFLDVDQYQGTEALLKYFEENNGKLKFYVDEQGRPNFRTVGQNEFQESDSKKNKTISPITVAEVDH